MTLVKILTNDDGDIDESPSWCYIEIVCGSPTVFCTGEYFGLGESAVKYETKEVEKGGITCPNCLERIRTIKKIKL